LASVLEETKPCVDLRSHAPFAELAALCVLRDLRRRDLPQPFLPRLSKAHGGRGNVGEDDERVRLERSGDERGRPVLVDHGFDSLEPSPGPLDDRDPAAARHDRHDPAAPARRQQRANGVPFEPADRLGRWHHPTPTAAGSIVPHLPAHPLTKEPCLGFRIVSSDRFRRMSEGRISLGDESPRDECQDDARRPGRLQRRGQLLLDQIADLALRFGAENVHRSPRKLSFGDLVLSEQDADLRAVPMGDDKIMPIDGERGEDLRRGPHLLGRFVPGSPAAGPGQGVAAQRNQDPAHRPPRRRGRRGMRNNSFPRTRRRRFPSTSPIYAGPAPRDVADLGNDLLCPLEFRYGRNEVRALFSRSARLRRALRVEAALAETEADLDLVPASAAAAIRRAAEGTGVTLQKVDALERELQHDVMAITRVLAHEAGEGGRWVHYGATSADITDTALALELKEAVGILRTDLTELARVLLEKAREYHDTPEIGRTHGQHAVPLSFGYKMAVGAAEVLRHRARLDEVASRLLVGKMAGAVGTGAGFGARAGEIEAGVMRRLGLEADEAPTQIVGRDRLAEFAAWLALVSGTADRLATEIRNLQRTEIGEAQEPFDEARQVGSSTMAQKRNPRLAENVSSLARLVRGLAWPPLENMVQWHERDLANSANERIVFPHAVVLVDDILAKLARLYAGLLVNAERMAQNLAASGAAVMSENLMLALTVRGLPRAEAHEVLRSLTQKETTPKSLLARAKEHPVLSKHFTGEEIEELVDPETYVRAARAKTDRIVQRLTLELGR
jgi:adenylosuccinate lyase